MTAITDFSTVLPARVSPATAWIETLGLTALVPGLGYGLQPLDPLFMNAKFPWLILGPILLGLRYSLAHSLSSALMLIAAIGAYWHYGPAGRMPFPGELVIGLLLVTLTTNEFRAVWELRTHRLSEICSYHQRRLVEFSRIYAVLKASHALLEHQAGESRLSLRSALTRLKESMASVSGENRGTVAAKCLELFGQYGHLQSAAFFWVMPDGGIEPDYAARIGDPPEAWTSQESILEAVRSRAPICLDPARREKLDGWLAAIPLVDAGNRVWAVIAIHEMPFGLFKRHHFDLLAILGGYAADIIAQWRKSCPDKGAAKFRLDMARCLTDARSRGIPASLIRFTVLPGPDAGEVEKFVFRSCRALDLTFLIAARGRPLILRILPLTGAIGAKFYIDQLKSTFKESFMEDMDDRVIIKVWPLSGQEKMDKLLMEIAHDASL
jgi:hypothetical protein